MPDHARHGRAPEVSVIMATRDRPRLLSVALRCCRQQTFAGRELIIVDDGDVYPADAQAVEAAGGRLIRMEPGTSLGTKLNRGVEQARAPLCQKMDDDDWYAPDFLEKMVTAFRESQEVVCQPVVAFLMPFLFFEIARWEVRRSLIGNAPGATLMFTRDGWEQHPFRALSQDEDVWFLVDQSRRGATVLQVRSLESFIAIRHRGSVREREHAWTHQFDGRTLEQHLKERPLYDRRPEDLVAPWAVEVYQELHREIVAANRNG